jgi:hypothetical protein
MAKTASEKMIENPALEREANTCKRHKLLKALWRLGKYRRLRAVTIQRRHESGAGGPTTHDRDQPLQPGANHSLIGESPPCNSAEI